MDALIDRRLFIGAAGAAALVGLAGPAAAFAPVPGGFVMWHSPGCQCCLQWVKRMETAFGRKLPIVEAPDIAAVKKAQGVPGDLVSCHTALIQGYVIEGHVPPADIKRLVASKNRKVKGLAVPGMPVGAPGMEVAGSSEPYEVIAFARDGKRSVFARHG